ncbi:MAG: hypothetical protein KatS3mg131_4016 [Candidatus Tectimicrobiota bacterium]|nr:MAG: hypothetical protein KatS3mg131_4016 [Candidatus Tectomicrobia bacterium]
MSFSLPISSACWRTLATAATAPPSSKRVCEAARLYLVAYALGFGATGLTFFDDEVSAFFSPHAAGQSVMFLVALGYGARRRPA